MQTKYYIEEIIKSNTSKDMITIILSTSDHTACIEIHGDPIKATERMVKVLNGLNND